MRRALLAALTGLILLPGAAHAFSLGFNDDDLMRNAGWLGAPVDEPALTTGLANARSAGASTLRFSVHWRSVARAASTAPSPATLAADPAWAGYQWGDVDRIVRTASAQGLQPLPYLKSAPAWAEGADRPNVAPLYPAGTWKPSATHFEQFARAIARRYDGTYPDPERPGSALPRISTFQAWNEPNIWVELTPQWERRGNRWRMYSASAFRKLVNAAARGIKASQPNATVLTAGTAPFGDFNFGDPRVPPRYFWRELLCVRDTNDNLRAAPSCPKLRADGWAHHMYPVGSPTRAARNPDDVVVPNVPRLQRVLRTAAKAGTITQRTSRNLWITEISWESKPDPDGLSPELHARYLQGAVSLLERMGAQRVLWWGSRDQAQGNNWNATLQSGIFYRGADPSQDTPKPSFTAYRFPFSAYRTNGRAIVWTKAPGPGSVAVQRLRGGAWTTIATLTPRADGVARRAVRLPAGVQLRAVQGADTSLIWTT